MLWLEFFRLLAFFPSLAPIFGVRMFIPRTGFCQRVMCRQVPVRWTVAGLPWGPPCC